MAKELIERSEVKVEDTWDLSDMYKSKEDWEKDLEFVKKTADELAKKEGKVTESAKTLLYVMEEEAKIDEKLLFAYEYAARLHDEDQADTEHQSMAAKAYSAWSDIGAKLSFITPEIVAMDESVLDKYMEEEEGLKLYKRQFEMIFKKKPHTLSAESEKLIAMTAEMASVAGDTFEIFDNANVVFPEITDADGEKVRITHGRFIPFLECPDRRVREDAFNAYYNTYKQFINTYASLYNGQVKQQLFYSKARKYDSNLEHAVLSNEVSPVVYKTLVDTVNKNLDKLHRYVKLRKRLLGVDELHMYDVYTPIIKDVAREYSFTEAKELALKALAPLGDDYVALVKEGFDNRWIDVYENKGKTSGAYSAGAYGVHPYVLLNYNGSLDNVFTLVHEMGHSIHSYLSNKNQPFIYSQYKIFVAEVASTCNEILLLEYLLKNTEDKKMKAYLLNHYLDSFKGTVYRQTMFAEFELASNELVEKGESLNADNLSDIYLSINKKYYGPDMISDDLIKYEWARIPHFYMNYYVYQYATSFCASVAIAHEILEGGADTVERYKKFLSAGCTKPPVELLKDMGIDLETPKPIEEALAVMDGVLDEIEALV